ncbi:MAG: hypothetical protein AAFU77_08090 [Myxococcota bacterium]
MFTVLSGSMNEESQGSSIACSLNTEEFRKRRRFARNEVLPFVTKLHQLEGGLELFFAERSDAHEAVERFVELERQCCGFLSFDVRPTPQRDGFVLRVTGPNGTRDTITLLREAAQEAMALRPGH